MRQYEWGDERDEIIRPLKKKDKPSVKKSNHKHEYEVHTDDYVKVYKCIHCDKIQQRIFYTRYADNY